MQGRHGHLSADQKQLAFRLRARGWRLIDIAREIGCTAPMIGLMVPDGRHREAESFAGNRGRGVSRSTSVNRSFSAEAIR
jgi:hypothetical protein